MHKSRIEYDVVLDSPKLMDKPNKIGTLAIVPYSDAPPSFTYTKEWLENPTAFRLGPELDLYQGPQYPPSPHKCFGFMADVSPDRWGQRLLVRRESSLARMEARKPRTLFSSDILIGVEDVTRMGSLRFREQGTLEYVSRSGNPVPLLTHIRRLEKAAIRFETAYDRENAQDDFELKELFAPGSSMGGARPKAVVEHNGQLYLAKFPSFNDNRDVEGWEYLLYKLAREAGIDVSDSKLIKTAAKKNILIIKRFDREGSARLHYASAMTLLGRQDGDENVSYLDIADFIIREGGNGYIASDLKRLFTRVAFNVAVGNRDDHLRNHGFLRFKEGWRLSPVFDINPNPEKREHHLAIDETNHGGDLAIVESTCRNYRLKLVDAQKILDTVVKTVSTWKKRAKMMNLSETEMQQMEGTFIDQVKVRDQG